MAFDYLIAPVRHPRPAFQEHFSHVHWRVWRELRRADHSSNSSFICPYRSLWRFEIRLSPSFFLLLLCRAAQGTRTHPLILKDLLNSNLSANALVVLCSFRRCALQCVKAEMFKMPRRKLPGSLALRLYCVSHKSHAVNELMQVQQLSFGLRSLQALSLFE